MVWEEGRSRHGRRLPIETVLGTTADGSETITHAGLATEPPLTWENPYRQYALPGADDVARADTWLGLHRSIVEGRPAVYGASARTDLELLIAIRESSRQGNRRLDLPVREPTELEWQLHAEFAQQYGGEPFEDAEALLTRLFPAPSLTRSPYSLGVSAVGGAGSEPNPRPLPQQGRGVRVEGSRSTGPPMAPRFAGGRGFPRARE